MSEASNLIEALTAEEVEAIEREVAHLPDRRSAAIDAMLIVQERRGWISDASLHAIAKLLEMSPAEVDSIATFYNLIHRKPVGRHVVMVCDSVSCFVMGCDRVRQAICDHLGIQPGETTEDERYTLLPIVCLGACDRAPAMMVDDQLIGDVEPAQVGDLLEDFR